MQGEAAWGFLAGRARPECPRAQLLPGGGRVGSVALCCGRWWALCRVRTGSEGSAGGAPAAGTQPPAPLPQVQSWPFSRHSPDTVIAFLGVSRYAGAWRGPSGSPGERGCCWNPSLLSLVPATSGNPSCEAVLGAGPGRQVVREGWVGWGAVGRQTWRKRSALLPLPGGLGQR